MELTVAEALERGIAAHREGKLQDAERFYRAILRAQPKHPDANHNLGVLAVAVGKVSDALPLFKQALEANPQIDQFWLSYIDVLIKSELFEEAAQALSDGSQSGISSERLESLRKQLKSAPDQGGKKARKGFAVADRRKKKTHKKKRGAGRLTAGAGPTPEYVSRLQEHYQAGRLIEAELLATSLTQNFSEHPLGWKILGAVLKQTGRHAESLVAEQKSVELAPEDAEVHNNLGNTLKEIGRLEEAEASYKKALGLNSNSAVIYYNLGVTLNQLGRLDEAESSFKQAIALKSDFAEAYSNLGNTLSAADRLNEAEASYQRAIALQPAAAEPHFNLGICLQRLGKLEVAVVAYERALKCRPGWAEAHCNLGNTVRELGRLSEAAASYERATQLDPKFAMAHFNLGNSLRQLGKLNDAEASYRRAAALDGNLPELHNNLGVTLKELNRLEEAEASYKNAIALKSDFAAAHNNLGNVLKELGRLGAAISSYAAAIKLEPDYAEPKVNLGNALKNAVFHGSEPWLYSPISHLLKTGYFVRPREVSRNILNLLKFDPVVSDLLAWDSTSAERHEVESLIKALNQLSLLHDLMRTCPLPDLDFEVIFAAVRRSLLEHLRNLEEIPELIDFMSTMALHCFVNEHLYFETDEETQQVEELETKVAEAVAMAEQPRLIELLSLACYRPLHGYAWCEKLEFPDENKELKARLIDEPLIEREYARQIPSLAEISDSVSRKVREQYEEHPYPRWVKLAMPLKTQTVAALCDELELNLRSFDVKQMSAPEILVAGCGTGQHSIGTAARFTNCHVTAIDLSLASIGYAKRKTHELGISNLEYLQADILDLHSLGKEFDVIESAGVLHHMDDPLAGWQVLTDLLRPGGLMKIGLYSESARRDVVKIRDEISGRNIGTSDADIRRFRQSLIESEAEHHKTITRFGDFFSLSEVRDLIFHAREHRFTLPKIEEYLDALGLHFCGFELPNVVENFREGYGSEADIYDLTLWQRFEVENPYAFSNMYQFWCQKT